MKFIGITGAEFDAMMALSGDSVREVKNRQTLRVSIDGEPLFIKKHQGISVGEVLKNIVRGQWPVVGATPEYEAIEALTKAGVRVPRLHSFGVRGACWFSQRSFVAMHEVDHPFNLEQLVKTWSTAPPSLLFKRALIKKVATIARKMHDAGINHRDFYLCHFLFSGSEAAFELTLIDLHRAQQRQQVPFRWQVKDLAGLFYSATDVGFTQHDIYYFMRHYHQSDLKTVFKCHRSLWAAVRKKTQALYARKGRYPR